MAGVDEAGRRIARHEGVKRKAALAKPLSLMCTTSETSRDWGGAAAESNSDAIRMGNAFSGEACCYKIHAVEFARCLK